MVSRRIIIDLLGNGWGETGVIVMPVCIAWKKLIGKGQRRAECCNKFCNNLSIGLSLATIP
jgi:hypothetical protein